MAEQEENCCQRKMPLFESLVTTAKQIVQKPTFASQEQQEERLAICQTCEFFTKNETCELCGCRMRIKVKAGGVKCPHDPPKWTEI